MHTTGYGTAACWSVASVLPGCSIISRVAALLHGESAAFDGDCNLAADSLALTAELSHHSSVVDKLRHGYLCSCWALGVTVCSSLQELLDEFFNAVQRRFGNTVLIHLEDMQYENMSKTMAQYSGNFPVFSDDIQGLAAVVIAGILAAAPLTSKKLADHIPDCW
jgi:hypothetical protein